MSKLFFAQKAFIVRDQTVLLVRKSADDPNQPGKWEVPGGRMEFGEEVDDHLRREVREEVGLEVTPGPPFHIWQWRLSRRLDDGNPIEMQIVAVARFCRPVTTQLSEAGRVAEDYLAEMAWVPFDDVPSFDIIPNMRPVIDSFLNHVRSDCSLV